MTRLTPRNVELADDATIEMCRAMTGEQKRRASAALFRFALRRLTDHLRHHHPDWTDEQIRREIVRRNGHAR